MDLDSLIKLYMPSSPFSRVGVQLWKYETQSIDLPTLVRNLQHMKGITFQYFFGTEEAIKLLKRI